MFDLTGPGIELQTYLADDVCNHFANLLVVEKSDSLSAVQEHSVAWHVKLRYYQVALLSSSFF